MLAALAARAGALSPEQAVTALHCIGLLALWTPLEPAGAGAGAGAGGGEEEGGGGGGGGAAAEAALGAALVARAGAGARGFDQDLEESPHSPPPPSY